VGCTAAPSSPVPGIAGLRTVRALAGSDGGTRAPDPLGGPRLGGPRRHLVPPAALGRPLYIELYAEELARFAPRLPPEVRADVPRLWEEARKAGVGLLAPGLDVIFSSGRNGDTLDSVLAGLETPEQRLLPAYRDSAYWSAETWSWLLKTRPRLTTVFRGLRTAGFVRFRAERAGKALDGRVASVQRDLESFDVIAWQEKLTGRTFDPTITIVLLLFCKPHGIKVQGQTFLQAYDYDTPTTVRIAAHEMLHPPVPMDGGRTSGARGVLEGRADHSHREGA
jgi:hypothetical protein